MTIQVGDTVAYAGQVWRVHGTNDRYVWIARVGIPTRAPIRVERDKVTLVERESEVTR